MKHLNFMPTPGEVWICTENNYSRRTSSQKDRQERIIWYNADKPFIVLFITQFRIHYVQAGLGHEPNVAWVDISQDWHWLEHFTRVWPPAPSWDQLRAAGLVEIAEEVQ